MYEEAMQGVHDQLVQKTLTKHMTYIAELMPSGTVGGEPYVSFEQIFSPILMQT